MKAAPPEAPAPTKDEDLEELARLADRIDELNGTLDTLFDDRRIIWARRLEAEDTPKAELARASRCHPMNVTQGLKPELLEKARAR